MNCDMCGREEQLFKTEIEGTMMNVCEKCSAYGKVIGKVRIQDTGEEIKPEPLSIRSSMHNTTAARPMPIDIIITNYAGLIKTARERKGLKQEEVAKQINEKESLLHHVESGNMPPNMVLARKLERFFTIKLVEQYVEQPTAKAAGGKGEKEMTLADVAHIKTKGRR